MADKLFVKPAQGLKIPNPETGRDLPPYGALVGNTVYWRRLLRDLSVVETDANGIAKGKAEAEAKASAEPAPAEAAVPAETIVKKGK